MTSETTLEVVIGNLLTSHKMELSMLPNMIEMAKAYGTTEQGELYANRARWLLNTIDKLTAQLAELNVPRVEEA